MKDTRSSLSLKFFPVTIFKTNEIILNTKCAQDFITHRSTYISLAHQVLKKEAETWYYV